MADARRLKSIAARYDVKVQGHTVPWRQYRRWLNFAAVPAAVLISAAFLVGDHRGLQSRPVSNAHQSFEQNCQACHQSAFRTLQRLVSFDNDVHSVTSASCRQCHVEQVRDHVDHSLAATSLLESLPAADRAEIDRLFSGADCAGCHQEHRGKTLLATVRDVFCVDCHQESATVSGVQFALDFDSFESHPEFAFHRPVGESDPGRHRSLQLTTIVDGERTDAVRFQFNHHVHLDPELPSADRRPGRLECQSCHQPDGSGAYFQPISFEAHCQKCHALGFADTGELPHESPEIIRGLLLDRLANHERSTPGAVDELGGLTTHDPPAEDTSADRLAGLQSELKVLERRLFGDPAERHTTGSPKALLEASCTKCHQTMQSVGEADETDNQTSWKIVPPEIPDRWFPHAKFRHDRHDLVKCDQCHSQGAGELLDTDRDEFYPQLTGEQASSRSIFASRSARDILMPGVNVCRTCHDPDRAASGTAVAADCVTCHAYHHEDEVDPEGTEFLKLLTGTAPSSR